MSPSRTKQVLDLLLCSARNWSADNASTTGASLAFFCAFSLAPLLVILAAVAGAIIGAEAAYGQIGAQLTGLFGQGMSRVLLEAVRRSQQADGLIATGISVVTLLIGATTVLAALEAALQTIWRDTALTRSGIWGWFRTRLLSLGFILALGFLLLISLTITTGLANVREWFVDRHPLLVGAVGGIDLLLSLLCVSGLFAVIYRYMPARRLPWRVVLTGGFFTALLFDVGRWAVGLYLAHSAQPTAFGAAASFAALLLWLYYTAQIFLFGAEFTACLGGRRREGQAPAKAGKRRERR
jgi:membrane protein